MGWAWGLGPGLKILPTTLIPLGWLQHDQGWDSTFQLTFTQTNFYLIREAIESYRPFPCSQSGICIFAGWPPPQTPTSFVDLQGLKKTRWGTPPPQLTLLGDQISGGKPTRWQCLYREDIQDCRTERPARRERSAPSLACWGQRPFGVRSTLGATLPRI